MSRIISQFAHIFIHYYSNKAYSTCKLFVSEPTKSQEEKMGRLFGIFEINTPSRENTSIITQLINDLEETYYSQTDDDFEIETAFGKSLLQINQKFSQLIKEKKFYLVGNLNEQTIKEKINLGIGVLKDNKIYISYLNNIGIFLIHKTKQDYKIIDITKIANDEKLINKRQEENKLLTNLIEGNINPPDYLFLANKDFLNYVSLERIQRIITSIPLHKAAEYFKNSLLQFEGHNFAAIILKNTTQDIIETKPHTSLTSITELNYTESSTEKLLEPSFWDNFKKFFLLIWSKIFIKVKDQKIQNNQKIEEKKELPKTTTSAFWLKKLLQLIKNIGHYFNLKFRKTLSKADTQMPALSEKLQISKNLLRLKFAYISNNFKKIPNLSKILLIIALFFIILFVYSMSYFKQQQQGEISSKEFQAIVNQIEEKRNQAESDLIYGNEEKARTEIAEAQKLLATLPLKSQKQKDKQKELAASIEIIIAKLRHITTISEPNLIADLSSQIETNSVLNNLILSGNYLLIFDSGNNTTYQINLETREIKKINSNLLDIGQIVKAKKIENKILLYHTKNGFVEFKDNRFIPFPVSLAANAKIIDYAFYYNRLYTLDSTSNQIYRQPKIDSGYASGNIWLREALDLSDIISLGIDTNIWLLNKTGQVIKLNKGRKQNFSPQNIEPILEAPNQLFTNDETNYLYILEPKNKRIVVLDKEGNLITQYYSAAFDNLKAMEILEKEKKMFLIDGYKIYFINLSHI